MNEQEQRITFAEAHGWKFTRGSDGEYHTYEPFGEHVSSDWYGFSMAGVPNYLHDLNAAVAARNAIFSTRPGYYERSFVSSLMEVHGINSDRNLMLDKRMVYTLLDSSAAQVVEATLRTIGKWRD